MIIAVNRLSKRQKKDIWALVSDSDHEFVPPLSARKGTTQAQLTGEEAKGVPVEYFEALTRQSFILCIKGFRVVGFMSYIKDHKLEAGGSLNVICDYISTIIVKKEYRKRGFTTGMYEKLFRYRPGKTYATRTWSLNHAHLSLLNKLGFKLALRIENDRGAGIDTVYYVRGDSYAAEKDELS